MNCKIEKKNIVKTLCLRIKLKNLEKKRMSELQKLINSNPSRISRIDDIESNLSPEVFREINSKILAAKRLLAKILKN